MGGRGTYAIGNNVDYSYETVKKIHGVKVLESIDKGKSKKLPEEAHSSSAYILLDKDGRFQRMRIYSSKGEAVMDIDYHKEKEFGTEKVLHIHQLKNPGIENRNKTVPRLLSSKEFNRYKKFFVGVI